MTGIELVQVHPGLRVAESNRLNGNLNPRFSDVEEVYESRMRLMGAAGCDQMVVMLPKGRDRYQDLEDGLVTAPKEAYDKWPEDLRPDQDVEYDPEDPPRMIDLPFDGFITGQPGKGLLLAAADCAPAAIYDPRQRVLALAHNGREGAALDISPHVIGSMERTHGTDPADLVVHFGASIAAQSYVLTYLGEALRKEAWRPYVREVDGGYETDIVGYVIQRLLEKGVKGENISRSPIDTFGHPDYFSFVEHSADPKNVPDGRNGFIAVLLEQETQLAA